MELTSTNGQALKTEKVHVGVLGAGNYATAVFLPAIKNTGGVDLVGISSAGGVTAKAAAQKFGFSFASTDENEILENPAINTVVVLTRHNHHARQVLSALKAGKNVYCEKPLALTEEDLVQIIEEAGKTSCSFVDSRF